MADEVKITIPAGKTAGKTVKSAPAARKAPAKKAVEKPAPKAVKAQKAVKEEAKAEKPARGGRAKKPAPSIHDVTTALWNKIEKADVSGVETPIAIQVIVNDFGTFFVAVKDDGEGKGKKPHVIQDVYNDRDGTVEISYEEIMKIVDGTVKYDYLSAVSKGVMRYQGDLGKAIVLANLLK